MADKEPVRWITVNGAHVPIYEGENEANVKERIDSFSSGRKQGKINEQNEDGSITMTYVHIHNKTQKIKGMDFGQDIEPAGEYMNMDTMQGKNKIDQPNYEYGTIHFSKPLVLEWKSTDSHGWKKTLSEMYGGKKGKALSKAIMKDGYDAIMTWEEYKGKKEWSEIVNLKGKKM